MDQHNIVELKFKNMHFHADLLDLKNTPSFIGVRDVDFSIFLENQDTDLDHKKPFHDAIWALKHKFRWKVPELDALWVFVILRDLLAVSVKQFLEGAQNWDAYLYSLHPFLKLHLKQLFRD